MKSINLLLTCFLLIGALKTSAQLQGSFESKFKRYTRGENFNGVQTTAWQDTAWKGDRLYKQIVLWSDRNINNLTYETSDLVGMDYTIPKERVNLKFGSYIVGDPEARGCSQYPNRTVKVYIADALTDTRVVSLKSDDPIKIFVTIDIPVTVPTGLYEGSVIVKSGGSPQKVFNIKLHVITATLPPPSEWTFFLDLWQFPFNALGWYNHNHPNQKIESYSDSYFKLIKPYYQLLADAGQKSVTVTLPNGEDWQERFIKWTKGADGKWQYDFSHFDLTVDSMSSWGITSQITCLGMANQWNETLWYWDAASSRFLSVNAPVGSNAFNEMWGNFLRSFRSHLVAKGWFNKTVLWLDELDEATMLKVMPLITADSKDWKMGRAGDAVSSKVYSQLFNSSVFYGASPPAGSRPAGAITTWYTSCSNHFPNSFVTLVNSPAEMGWLCWNAAKNNLDGYLRWAYDFWQLNDPSDAQDVENTAGDFSMVYRASNDMPSVVLPSMRMTLLRDGIQDFEKIRILKAALSNSANTAQLSQLNDAINNFIPSTAVTASQVVGKGQSVLKKLAFLTNPLITMQPKDQSVYDGGNAVFTVTAPNASTYQWQVNYGTGWHNQSTTSSNRLANLVLGNEGFRYRVIVRDNAGHMDISREAILHVSPYISASLITVQPQDQWVYDGGTVVFTVTAPNAATYQWQVNYGTGWHNQSTSSTNTLTNLVLGNEGFRYRVIVRSNAGQTETSREAVLHVSPSLITVQPQDQSVYDGGTAIFTVTAPNAATYQWQVNYGTGWHNQSTSSTNTLTNLVLGNEGFRYRVIVRSNTGQTETSREAVLHVSPYLPASLITVQPQDQSVYDGGTVVFTVTAPTASTYQWQVNYGTGWHNQSTTSTNTLTNLVLGNEGFRYRVIVRSNAGQTETSREAVLHVSPYLSASLIRVQPQDQWVYDGGTVVFTVTAPTAATYQWQVNYGTGWHNQSTTSTNTLTNLVLGNEGFRYRVIVRSNAGQTETSREAVLHVSVPTGARAAIYNELNQADTLSAVGDAEPRIGTSKMSLVIYPNPAGRLVHVGYNLKEGNKGILQIRDITGHIWLSKNLSDVKGKNRITVSLNLPVGTYLLTVRDGKNQETGKLVINRSSVAE